MLKCEKRAATSLKALAPEQHQKQLYDQPEPLSSAKLRENLAVLLLYLQTPLSQCQRKRCWQVFEGMLRQYVTLKQAGGAL